MSEDGQLGPVARRLSARHRVLSFEDEPDIAAFLRAYFRAAGYDFVHVDPDDIAAIMAALDEHDPDLVLLDVRLRQFSGLEAYRMMRSDDRWAFTPVIIVSAHAASDPDFEAPQGIDGFVPKPFNTNVLAELVGEKIAQAKALSAVGRSTDLQLFTQEYLELRLIDEIAVAGDQGSFGFALVNLRSIDQVRAEVGEEGLDYMTASLIERARDLLPDHAVIGITDGSEIAVVLPGINARDAHAAMAKTLGEVSGEFRFAGGATVDVRLACGVASYPSNATDPGGLFMAADSALASAVENGLLLSRAL